MLRKSITLVLLILWTLHVQSPFSTGPGAEFAKLINHDHWKVGDIIAGNEHRQRPCPGSLVEIGTSHRPVGRASLQQRKYIEFLALRHFYGYKLYELNHVFRI